MKVLIILSLSLSLVCLAGPKPKQRHCRDSFRIRTSKQDNKSVSALLREANKYFRAKDFKKAFPLNKKAAERNSPEAMFNLGMMYDWGLGVGKNYKEALLWYEKAAWLGLPKAQLNLGFMYFLGRGVARDKIKAADWYEKSYKQGNPIAAYNLGLMYDGGYGFLKNYKKAVELYQYSAGKRYAPGERNLGFMYYYGRAVDQDKENAAELFKRAGDQGDAVALYNLGLMYRSGEGSLPKDEKLAFELIEKSSRRGYAVAQLEMGEHLLALGSEEEALKWYNKAIEQGNKKAMLDLGVWFYNSNITERQKEGLALINEAADGRSPEAQYVLGLAYETGLVGVLPKNIKSALFWLDKAGRQGYKPAQIKLERIREEKRDRSLNKPAQPPQAEAVQNAPTFSSSDFR